MVFSSMLFVTLFLPLAFFLYFAFSSPKARNMVLMLFSIVFYAWGEPVWIFVMLLTVTVNYFCGLLIDSAQTKKRRVTAMVTGVTLSLAFLFYFKYFGFFTDIAFSLFGSENPLTKPILPIGISFYTFQVLTYTVDVFRGKVPVQKSFTKLLLYVSFFPQLIAGPIVNYTDIEPYLDKREVKSRDVYEGLMRFFTGLAKKALLANTCGIITDKLTAEGTTLSVAGGWLIAVAYAFQIYFDFSGYSDMAIGMGRMFGFKFFENFNYPYISKSVTEFWRRWHISLGTFFREYVYIPLGGNRVSKAKHIRNILIVWLLTGFWHGASWNFIVWGLYYGVLLLVEKYLLKSVKERLPAIVNIPVTLLFVLIGWVLFYYEDLGTGVYHIGTMFGLTDAPLTDFKTIYYFKNYAVVLVISALACIPWKAVFASLSQKQAKAVAIYAEYAKPITVTVLFILSMAVLITQSYNPFLYFRF